MESKTSAVRFLVRPSNAALSQRFSAPVRSPWKPEPKLQQRRYPAIYGNAALIRLR